MDDDMLFAKFDSMVLPLTGEDRRNKILETILHLEKLKDVADFTKLLG
jgi:hypothetical protein